ncbi:MAG: hypothetical protein QOC65_435 [Sphingomonadales bacterium]|nr:hypothetical protein [Sphingomonadales bacterium]
MIQAARLFALAVLAVSPASAAVPEDAPVYSLVAGRQTRFQGRADLCCFTRPDGGRWCPEYASAWLDHARTLAGSPIGESFDASTERGPAHYRPVLVVLLHRPGGIARIVAQAEAGPDGRACLATAEMDRIGWHPSGPDILVLSRGVCADLSALAAIPAPPPLTVVGDDGDLRRALRRERRRSRPR